VYEGKISGLHLTEINYIQGLFSLAGRFEVEIKCHISVRLSWCKSRAVRLSRPLLLDHHCKKCLKHGVEPSQSLAQFILKYAHNRRSFIGGNVKNSLPEKIQSKRPPGIVRELDGRLGFALLRVKTSFKPLKSKNNWVHTETEFGVRALVNRTLNYFDDENL